MGSNKDLGFKEVLDKLKNDIKSIQKQDEKDRMFILNDIEIELSLTINKEGDGGINIGIVKAGGKVAKESIHKVILKLTPFTNGDEQTNKQNSNTSDDPKNKSPGGGGSAYHPKYNPMILDKRRD